MLRRFAVQSLCVVAGLLALSSYRLLTAELWHIRLPRHTPNEASHDANVSSACTEPPAAPRREPGCLQQAMWGKCDEPYMRSCDVSCGRCASNARADAMRRVLLVSARQSAACVQPGGEEWVRRAMRNKERYAELHGLRGTLWTSETLDPDYDGAWNKLVYLAKLMRLALSPPPAGEAAVAMAAATAAAAASGGHGAGAAGALDDMRGVEWLLWMDWDVVVTDHSHELPVEEYEAMGWRLVLGGDPKGVDDVDYLKLNSGG